MSKRNCARGEKRESSLMKARSQFWLTPFDDEIKYRRIAAVHLAAVEGGSSEIAARRTGRRPSDATTRALMDARARSSLSTSSEIQSPADRLDGWLAPHSLARKAYSVSGTSEFLCAYHSISIDCR